MAETADDACSYDLPCIVERRALIVFLCISSNEHILMVRYRKTIDRFQHSTLRKEVLCRPNRINLE
jgi:hypothetical protein